MTDPDTELNSESTADTESGTDSEFSSDSVMNSESELNLDSVSKAKLDAGWEAKTESETGLKTGAEWAASRVIRLAELDKMLSGADDDDDGDDSKDVNWGRNAWRRGENPRDRAARGNEPEGVGESPPGRFRSEGKFEENSSGKRTSCSSCCNAKGGGENGVAQRELTGEEAKLRRCGGARDPIETGSDGNVGGKARGWSDGETGPEIGRRNFQEKVEAREEEAKMLSQRSRLTLGVAATAMTVEPSVAMGDGGDGKDDDDDDDDDDVYPRKFSRESEVAKETQKGVKLESRQGLQRQRQRQQPRRRRQMHDDDVDVDDNYGDHDDDDDGSFDDDDDDDDDIGDVVEFSGTLREVYAHLEGYAQVGGGGAEGDTIRVLLDKLAVRIEKEEVEKIEEGRKRRKVVHLHRRKGPLNPRRSGARRYEWNGAQNGAWKETQNVAQGEARNDARDGGQKGARGVVQSSSRNQAKAKEIMKYIEGPGRVKFGGGGGGGACIENGRPCDDDDDDDDYDDGAEEEREAEEEEEDIMFLSETPEAPADYSGMRSGRRHDPGGSDWPPPWAGVDYAQTVEEQVVFLEGLGSFVTPPGWGGRLGTGKMARAANGANVRRR